MELPDSIDLDIDREIVEREGLRGFIEVGWSAVEAKPFKPGWHLDELTAHLEAVTRGQIRNLLINIPPGFTKSLSVCVFWPVWEWMDISPTTKWIFTSYSQRLSRRDAVRSRNLIGSDWFRTRWPHLDIPYEASRSAADFMNNSGGRRISSTLKGAVTGEHADVIVTDDPIKPMDAEGRRALLGTELDNAIDLWNGTLSTRQADPRRTRKVIIMQRLHERDLSGHVLAEESEEWEHLRLPMEYEPKFHCSTSVGGDRRTEDGELLCPERFPQEEVDKLKRRLGSMGTASQMQQRPNPIGGNIFKKHWFKYWGHAASPFPELPQGCRFIQAWDLTFKGAPTDGRRRSWVAGHLWAVKGSDFFLVDREHGQWEFVETCHAFLRLSSRWPKAFRKIVEDAANGPAIKSALQKRVPGIVLVSTGGGSEARAQAISPLWEAGNVWLPHVSICPWVVEVEGELVPFPNGATDDDVDAASHALVDMASGTAATYKAAMEAIL